MAVAAVLDFEGATLAQYDEVIKSMGFSPGGSGAPGALFHWVAQTDTGLRVVDVWEDRAKFERFAQEEIGPKTHAAGFPGAPKISFHDVHNVLTAG
ncbi:MAG: hypothetical protein NVSMB51_08160 [Solirubrobacteraceae bacterium]